MKRGRTLPHHNYLLSEAAGYFTAVVIGALGGLVVWAWLLSGSGLEVWP